MLVAAERSGCGAANHASTSAAEMVDGGTSNAKSNVYADADDEDDDGCTRPRCAAKAMRNRALRNFIFSHFLFLHIWISKSFELKKKAKSTCTFGKGR